MITMIVNPVSGAGRAKAVGEKAAALLHKLNVTFTLRLTEAIGHATELAKQAAERGDETVIAVGGDGTVNEVAAGLNEDKNGAGVSSLRATETTLPRHSASPKAGTKRFTTC